MELSLVLNNICNEDCPYCIAKTSNTYNLSNKKNFNKSLIKLRLDKYNYNDIHEVSIMGGEPGLVPLDDLKYLFDYLYDKKITDNMITVSTNGLFIEKYGNLYPNIDYRYHIISEDKFKIYHDKYKIEYTYIIYDINSIHDVISISSKNNDIIIYALLDESHNNYNLEFIKMFERLAKDYSNIKIFKEYNKPTKELAEIFYSSFNSEKSFKFANKLRLNAINNCCYIDLY